MRKKMAITLLVVLIAIAGVQSMANHTTARKATNVITAGGVQIRINQSADSKEESEEIEPGERRENIVRIENTGKNSAYVRMEVRVLSDGETIEAEDVLKLNIDMENWRYENGYYYYVRELKQGEETMALYTEEMFSEEALRDKYAGKEIEVEIIGYAVQSANNGEEATKAEGWPERKEAV